MPKPDVNFPATGQSNFPVGALPYLKDSSILWISFSLAVNRRNKQEGQPDADFIGCVAWNKTADLMAQYLHKGALIGVEGRIQTRNYDDKDGKRVYITEVVAESVQFLESKGTNSSQQSYTPQMNNQSGYTPDENNSSFDNEFAGDTLDIASDDLPF